MLAFKASDDPIEGIDDVPGIFDTLRYSSSVELLLGEVAWTLDIEIAFEALLMSLESHCRNSVVRLLLINLLRVVEREVGIGCDIDSRYFPELVIIAPAAVVHASGAADVAPAETPSTRH